MKSKINQKKLILSYVSLCRILSFKNIVKPLLILLLLVWGNFEAYPQSSRQKNDINKYAQNNRKYTISGSLELIDSRIARTANDCYGTGGYGDISGNMPIVIKDGEGKVLALGKTSNGKSPEGRYSMIICEFTFEINNVPKADFYSISLGRRKEIFYSYQELIERNWKIDLSLGL